MNLGGLQEELGDLAGAEEAFRTALRVQPSYALPHARLATLLRGQLPDQDLAAVEERLTDPTARRRTARPAAFRLGPRASTVEATTHAPPSAFARQTL